MKRLKQSCQGQVVVRVCGTQKARFLTVLIAREIFYENGHYEGADLFITLPAHRYREAIACAKKTGVRLRIISKRGWPFFYFRHRRRKWTLLFVLPLITAVFVLPRFVWTIEIDGLKAISQMEMLQRLEQEGITEGILKRDIDTDIIKNEMLLKYDDLSFVSLRLDGTQLIVLVEEAVKTPEIVDRNTPCDVIAKEDCILYSIVTESGMPLAKAGDEVQAGQVLIKGEIVLKDDSENETVILTHAAGEVYGKRVWRAEAEIKRNYEKKIWLDDIKKGIGIRCGRRELELRWPVQKAKQEAVIKEEIWSLPFGDFFSVYRLSYSEYKGERAEYSNEELKVRLREQLQRQADELLQMGTCISLEENWEFIDTTEGMKGVLEMVIMENIGQKVEVHNKTMDVTGDENEL